MNFGFIFEDTQNHIFYKMGCCPSSQPIDGVGQNDQQPMINVNNISREAGLINSAERAEPLLTGPDHLAFQNVDLSSGSDIDKNVLDDLMKSTSSDTVNEEEEDV